MTRATETTPAPEPLRTELYGPLYALVAKHFPHFRSPRGVLDQKRLYEALGCSASTLSRVFRSDQIDDRLAVRLMQLSRVEAEQFQDLRAIEKSDLVEYVLWE